jgi:hypothetical protein
LKGLIAFPMTWYVHRSSVVPQPLSSSMTA